ncbi:MAG: methyl-accepting chemotaxis protein [Planctomycetota bacterium]
MRWFSDLSMRVKLLALVGGMLLTVGAAFIGMFNQTVRRSARVEAESQAARVIDLAESVRHGMERKWAAGVFTQEQMSQWAHNGEQDKVLAAVPIVSAWEAVMLRAEENGYAFKTPRFNPRNPKHQPDELEAEVLHQFEADPTMESHSVVDEHHNTVRYFRPIRLTSECMMCHGDPSTSLAIWGNSDGIDATGYQMEDLREGDLYGAFEVIQSLDASDAAARSATLQGGSVIVGFLIACCGILALVLHRVLLKPLQSVSDALDQLADGNLSQHINVKCNDEVGRMQRGVNSMIRRLKEMILTMRGQSDDLQNVSDGLSNTATRVGGAALDTTSRTQTVSAAAEEMSVTMEQMGGSLREVGGNIQNVAAATAQVRTNANCVAERAEEASAVASQTLRMSEDGSQRVHEMESAAEDINKIISMIQGLAEQTNLLALNATIESARAGDAGRGFAVVANEVKQLSEQTSEATEGIRQQIEQIQSHSRGVVESIASIRQAAEEVNHKTDEIASAVRDQQNGIHSVSDELESIARNTETLASSVEQTVVASNEVAEQISHVCTLAETTANEANATKSAGGRVSAVSNEFTELLSGFRVH